MEIPNKRTFNYYLQTKISGDQKKELETLANDIIKIANKRKILLDINIVKKYIREKKKNYKREKREATKIAKRLFYPNINIPIHHNAKFNLRDFLDVLVYVGIKSGFANGGSDEFKEDNPNIESPSGDLMMHHFSKFKSVEEIQKMFDTILDLIFKFARKEYNLLNNRKFDVAYDVHKIPYFGKPMPYIIGGEYERGTSNFFEFLTCSIVVGGRRFILDILPVHPLDNLDKLVEKSLIKVKNKIRIDFVYLDRGFDRAKIINVLKKHGVKFIMPKIKSLTVKSWFDKSEGCESRVINNFQIGRGKDKALTNLFLVNDDKGVKRAFISNWDLSPIIAHKLYSLYSRRWGIEISYKSLKYDFRAKTTSRNYHIRLFYFFFSACLFNLWVLVNICIGLIINGKVPNKPLITARLFVTILYHIQEDYSDPGG